VLLTLVGLNLREVYGVRPCRCGPNGVDTISVNEHTDYVMSLLDVGDEFGCADDPILAHRFRVTACKALLSGRAIESREKGGEEHIQVQASRIGSIRQYLVARMVIHSREANPYPIGTGPVTHGHVLESHPWPSLVAVDGREREDSNPARSPSPFAQDSSPARCAQQQSGFSGE
jgi:hypothetical protein